MYEKNIIPLSLIWALGDAPTSYVEIKTNKPEKAEKEFTKLFKERWADAFAELEEDLGIFFKDDPDYYDDCDADASYPAVTMIKDDSVIVLLEPLLIEYCYGEFCEIPNCTEALDLALDDLQDKFPKAEISGLITFPWSDRRCGDTVCYPIGEQKEVYPIYADIVNHALKNENLFGQKVDYILCDFDDSLYDELTNDFDNEDYEIFDFLEQYQDLLSDEARNMIEATIKEAGNDVETFELTKARWEATKN